MKMTKSRPREPLKPTHPGDPPCDHCFSRIDRQIYDGVTLAEILAMLPAEVNPEDVIVEVVICSENYNEIGISWPDPVPKPNKYYASQLKKYQKLLAKYEENLKSYVLKYEAYVVELGTWEKEQSERDETERLARIATLEKQLKILREKSSTLPAE